MGSKPVVRERLAEADLEEHVDYLAARSELVALRFIDAAAHALERLGQSPEIGGLWNFTNPRLEGMRVWPIPGFRDYLIFYRMADETVQVLRILHGGRDLAKILME